MSVLGALQRAKNKGWIEATSKVVGSEISQSNESVHSTLSKNDIEKVTRSDRKQQVVIAKQEQKDRPEEPHHESDREIEPECSDVDELDELFSKLLTESDQAICESEPQNLSDSKTLKSREHPKGAPLINSKFKGSFKGRNLLASSHFDAAQEKWLQWKSVAEAGPENASEKIRDADSADHQESKFVFGAKISFRLNGKQVRHEQDGAKLPSTSKTASVGDSNTVTANRQEGFSRVHFQAREFFRSKVRSLQRGALAGWLARTMERCKVQMFL